MNVIFYKRNKFNSLAKHRVEPASKQNLGNVDLWFVKASECAEEMPAQSKNCTNWVRISEEEWCCIQHQDNLCFEFESLKWLTQHHALLTTLKKEYLID